MGKSGIHRVVLEYTAMLPIMFDLSRGPVLLYGAGAAAERRLRLLRDAGARDLRLFLDGRRPDDADLATAILVFIAGLDDAESGRAADVARRAGVPVKVEDRTAWCDFHTPALVRHGDLVISVSTGGRSPGLARRLRQKLETLFGPEWAERVDQIGVARDRWREEGCDMSTIARRTDEMIEKEGWL